MSGLKFETHAGGIGVAAYQEFTQKLNGTHNVSVAAYYEDIDEDNSKQRLKFLEVIASNNNCHLKTIDVDNTSPVIATNRNTRLTVTFDDLEPVGRRNKRKINLSLPHKNPTNLVYLEDYVTEIVLAATGNAPIMTNPQKKNSTELLLGIMLLTRCL